MTASATARPIGAQPERDRLGTVTGPREVTFVRDMPGPIERVWEFLVDGDKRKLWLAAGELEPRLGGRVTLIFHNATLTAPGESVPERFQKYTGVMESHGRVTAWDPPHRFAFSWWGEPEEVSEVSIALKEAPGGRVRLELVHCALKSRQEMLSISGGWHAHLDVLAAALEGRAPARFWATIDEVDRIYDETLPRD